MDVAIWGFCGHCEHWFACPEWFDRTRPQPCCTICQREPVAIVNRAAARFAGRHEVGQDPEGFSDRRDWHLGFSERQR